MSIGAILLFLPISLLAESITQSPWQTCSLTEGKGDGCGPGDRPRAFREYLVPGDWAKSQRDSFSAEFQWDLKQSSLGALSNQWREVGSLQSHRIREVRFLRAKDVIAGLVLAESSPGIFLPLMKWAGDMPQAEIFETGVLVLQKDFGGNVPMVSTWAWVWTPNGPVRLDVSGAIQAAVQKAMPGWRGLETGLDWRTLEGRTFVWTGDQPGKLGMSGSVHAWFRLSGTSLAVDRVEFQPAN